MAFWDQAKSVNPPTIEDVYLSPGHLIRRSHQISVSIFADELGRYELTPVQYASMLAIRDRPGIDQRQLGRVIAIDRSTVGTVLRTLEDKELVTRAVPEHNKRVKAVTITAKGETLLAETTDAIAQVQRRLLEPLNVKEREIFLTLLSRLVKVNNAHSRAPLKLGSDEPR